MAYRDFTIEILKDRFGLRLDERSDLFANVAPVPVSSLLQENLRSPSLELCHVQFPLFFPPHAYEILHRSAWGPLIHRGRFYPPGRVDGGAIKWAIEEIISLIRQEEKRGAALAIQVQNDPSFQPWLAAEPNLLGRIMCADPPPMP